MKPGRHICTVCNAIYEEPDEQVDQKKQSFDSLAEGWKCECGAGKDKFQPCSCVTLEKQADEHKHETHCVQKSK